MEGSGCIAIRSKQLKNQALKRSLSTMTPKKNYTYQDILRINNRRKKGINIKEKPEKVKRISGINIPDGQIIIDCPNGLEEIDSIEHFLYKFLKDDFIIDIPWAVETYNFDNLRLYTNPKEFEKEMRVAANNALLFGMDFTFNSFILVPTDDGWEVIGHTNSYQDVLIIPDFVTYIRAGAFKKFYNLKVLRLPNGLEKIGDYAFFGCKKLTEIKLPNSLDYIGNYAFCDSGLTEVTIPEKIKVIEGGVFNVAQNLEKVILPKSLEAISDWAFARTPLRQLVMPSVESIGHLAFYDSKLEGYLRLPKQLKKCYDTSFAGTAIDILSIPKGAKYEKDTLYTIESSEEVPNVYKY